MTDDEKAPLVVRITMLLGLILAGWALVGLAFYVVWRLVSWLT